MVGLGSNIPPARINACGGAAAFPLEKRRACPVPLRQALVLRVPLAPACRVSARSSSAAERSRRVFLRHAHAIRYLFAVFAFRQRHPLPELLLQHRVQHRGA